MMKTAIEYPKSQTSPRTGQTVWRLWVLLILLARAGWVQAQSPSVKTDHLAYLPDEPIIVTFSGGPGNPKDWIGIYPDAIEPGSQNSTLWAYVDDTQNGGTGLVEGTVTFTQGLTTAGDWVAFLLLNDIYTKLAQTKFSVIDFGQPYVRANKSVYTNQEPIQISFTNAPGNPTDWIGIYPVGVTPGGPAATLWNYVNGTQTATVGINEGTITFPTGLVTAGAYDAYLLENDGYTILATELFTVATPNASKPRLLTVYPANNGSNLPPVLEFLAAVTNGVSKVATNSIALTVDGTDVAPLLSQQGDLITVAYTNATLQPSGSAHLYTLTFSDDATPVNRVTNLIAFSVASYTNLVLPTPLAFENFDSTPEGQLPAGWTQTSYTDISLSDPAVDFGSLDSVAYAGWTVVNADRFRTNLVTYSDPTRTTDDYRRVLSVNPRNVVNGQFVRTLATGRMAFADSGYRTGQSQVQFLYSPDFTPTGKTNVYLSYHSVWEQNQDSIGAVEYSIDQGATWLPIVYMLATADVVTDADGTIDALTTFTNVYSDVALYTLPDTGEQLGGYYGAFIGVASNLWSTLGKYISPRIDDDPIESKRVEFFRLPAADNAAHVRFRFAHAGTDSWYFGLDDFGLYSITSVVPARLTALLSGGQLSLSWTADPGTKLQKTLNLSAPNWQDVPNTLGAANATEALGDRAAFYRLIKP